MEANRAPDSWEDQTDVMTDKLGSLNVDAPAFVPNVNAAVFVMPSMSFGQKQHTLMLMEMDGPEMTGEGPAQSTTHQIWSRDPPPDLDTSKDKLVFQQVEIDHYIGKVYPGMPGATSGPKPIMRMFGVTKDGNSVCCHVHGFHPYIYFPAPEGFDKDKLALFRKTLNSVLIEDMKSNPWGIDNAVLSCDLVSKSTIYGFQGNMKIQFIKVTLAIPKLVAAAKRLIEKGEVRVAGLGEFAAKAFEANIDFENRFMADTHVVGCNWIELPAGTWKRRSPDTKGDFGLMSRSQLEVDVSWEKFVSHAPEGEWSDVAPFRILSFDIECAGRKGIFPEAEKDPVIQIANMVVRQGEKEPFIRNVFTLDTCAQIVGSKVISCSNETDLEVISCSEETDLLSKWADFIRESDPDIITGYNINNFDIPYLLDRAKHLKVKNVNLNNLKVNLNNAETQQMNLDTRLVQLDAAIHMELWQEAYKAVEDIHGLMQLGNANVANGKGPHPGATSSSSSTSTTCTSSSKEWTAFPRGSGTPGTFWQPKLPAGSPKGVQIVHVAVQEGEWRYFAYKGSADKFLVEAGNENLKEKSGEAKAWVASAKGKYLTDDSDNTRFYFRDEIPVDIEKLKTPLPNFRITTNPIVEQGGVEIQKTFFMIKAFKNNEECNVYGKSLLPHVNQAIVVRPPLWDEDPFAEEVTSQQEWDKICRETVAMREEKAQQYRAEVERLREAKKKEQRNRDEDVD